MISKAINRAYRQADIRGYATIYWAIDLHGTCLRSNYEQGGYEFINDDARKALRKISDRPESKIILWSGCYPAEQADIIKFFTEHEIVVDFFNENPLEANTKFGDFSKKFYFSILLDDKAGFDPDCDWRNVMEALHWEDLAPGKTMKER